MFKWHIYPELRCSIFKTNPRAIINVNPQVSLAIVLEMNVPDASPSLISEHVLLLSALTHNTTKTN